MNLIREYLHPLAKKYEQALKTINTGEELEEFTRKILPEELTTHAVFAGVSMATNPENLIFKMNIENNSDIGNAIMFVNGVLEYIASEILELSGEVAHIQDSDSITVKAIKRVIEADLSLGEYVKIYTTNETKGKQVSKRSIQKKVKETPKKPVKKTCTQDDCPSGKLCNSKTGNCIQDTTTNRKKLGLPVKSVAHGYEAMTVKELRAKAKTRGLTGYSKLKKAELVQMLRSGKEASKSAPSSRKTSRKAARKTSRKAARKTSRKAARKTSRKAARKTSRKAARKTSRKTSVRKGSFESMTVSELKAKAKAKGLSGYSRLKKAELIKLLRK